MRRVVPLLLLIALSGCLKDDTQRLAIRNKLIEVQVMLETDSGYRDLRPAFSTLEAFVRAAEMDGDLTKQQIELVRDTIVLGETVDRNWRYDFFCLPSNSADECLILVKDSLSRMGVPEKLITNWLGTRLDIKQAKTMARAALISRLRTTIQNL